MYNLASGHSHTHTHTHTYARTHTGDIHLILLTDIHLWTLMKQGLHNFFLIRLLLLQKLEEDIHTSTYIGIKGNLPFLHVGILGCNAVWARHVKSFGGTYCLHLQGQTEL
jgi:hypothetical protein